ncbi:hypothetical protein FBZ89_12428 [Nitrospirillum amazonense]|uniref:Poly(3-hydroxybutyrate) depolymerase n=1 Tax=Nitrospirillum amazonense TaxID=28077 RepID=A0A560ET34_9PROT|nr:hypothetical protein [Nitrospirillum amazonense]TWB12415.1 hypothetical protein FBZ89_12428 [Nitrospirillum amazonense]
MRMWLRMMAVMAALACCAAARAQDCPGVEALRGAALLVSYGGVDFSVSVPEKCRAMQCGLIVDVHGATMTVDEQERAFHLRGLGAAAEGYGAPSPYIVVQPQAPGHPPQWRPDLSETVMGFAKCVSAALNVAPGRRHFGGFSQGAYMTAHFYCENSGFFASFAAVAGGAEMIKECLGGPHAPLLFIQGRSDTFVPFDYAREMLDVMKDRLPRQQAKGPDETIYTSHDMTVDVLLHDASGGMVGGHCVPGGEGRVGCPASFNAGERVLRFYIASAADKTEKPHS